MNAAPTSPRPSPPAEREKSALHKGRQMEAQAVRAWARRHRDKLMSVFTDPNEREARRDQLNDLLTFIDGRVARYRKKKGGL